VGAGSLPSIAAWDAMIKIIGVAAFVTTWLRKAISPPVPTSQGRRHALATKRGQRRMRYEHLMHFV
jgi:hypothetical protein